MSNEKINCAHSEIVEIHKIVPNPKNPNKHSDKQIERLAKIIDYQGQRSPIVISTLSGFVVKGHGRLMAMKKLEWEHVAVDYQDYESEAQEYADIVADNAIAEWSELDLDSIRNEINEIDFDLDFDLLGLNNFSLPEIEVLKSVKDDEAVPVVEHPITTRGDVWILGRHRLLCGDSTMFDDVDRLMNGNKADFGFCDPPYNLGFEYNSYNDNKTNEEYIEFSKNWFSNLQIFTERQAVTLGTKNIKIMAGLSDTIAGVACWVKKNWITSCHIAKLQQWEPIFFYGDYTKLKRSSDLFEVNRKYQDDVGDQYTCPKQIELIDDILENYCSESVVDLFGGSGTTLISAEKKEKTAFLVELDEKYCDVIIRRWENYTGQKAILEQTNQTYEELKLERQQ